MTAPPPVAPTAPEFTHTPITRADAAAAGLKFFFTGRICGHGHASRRYVSTGTCVVCQREHSTQRSKLYRTLRMQRGIDAPWFIVEGGTPAEQETAKATVRMLGLKVKEMQRGPRELARTTLPAPPGWKPPQELVNPIVAQTTPATPFGDAWQTDDRAGETVDEHPQHEVLHAPPPQPIPAPPHLIGKS